MPAQFQGGIPRPCGSQVAPVGDCPSKRPSARRQAQFGEPIGKGSGRFSRVVPLPVSVRIIVQPAASCAAIWAFGFLSEVETLAIPIRAVEVFTLRMPLAFGIHYFGNDPE